MTDKASNIDTVWSKKKVSNKKHEYSTPLLDADLVWMILHKRSTIYTNNNHQHINCTRGGCKNKII